MHETAKRVYFGMAKLSQFKPLCLKELSNVPPIGNTEAVLPLRLRQSSVRVTDEFQNKAKQEMFLKHRHSSEASL